MKLGIAVAASLLSFPALADDAKPLTVEQCMTVLNGLNSLNWVGQQLGEGPEKKPADAKQYKLGEARFTIALDISSLSPVRDAYVRGNQQFMAELPPIPPAPEGKQPMPEAQQMQADQNRQAIAYQVATLAKPCPVSLTTSGRLKLQELKLGDGPDQNAIPPSVLAAFSQIVDK